MHQEKVHGHLWSDFWSETCRIDRSARHQVAASSWLQVERGCGMSLSAARSTDVVLANALRRRLTIQKRNASVSIAGEGVCP